MIELKSCPFCGGKAVVYRQPIYGEKGLCIKCEQCKARTRLRAYDCVYLFYHGLRDVYINEETILIKAGCEWNTRNGK